MAVAICLRHTCFIPALVFLTDISVNSIQVFLRIDWLSKRHGNHSAEEPKTDRTQKPQGKASGKLLRHNQQKMERKIEHLRPPSKGNTKRSNARPCFGVRLYALVFKRSFFVLVMASFASFVCSFPCVAFSGSRLSGSSAAASCRAFLPLLSSFSGAVGVGCASGVDAGCRSAFPSASVFRVQPPLSRAAFAARSARLVQWCAASGGLLVAFPVAAAPARLAPSVSFAGFGSGSWGSVALALGLGVPVLVVLPAAVCPVGAALPAPAAVACRFAFVGAAPGGGSLWLASPAPVQLALF